MNLSSNEDEYFFTIDVLEDDYTTLEEIVGNEMEESNIPLTSKNNEGFDEVAYFLFMSLCTS